MGSTRVEHTSPVSCQIFVLPSFPFSAFLPFLFLEKIEIANNLIKTSEQISSRTLVGQLFLVVVAGNGMGTSIVAQWTCGCHIYLNGGLGLGNRRLLMWACPWVGRQ